MADAGDQLHEWHHRKAKGGAIQPPRRDTDSHQQRPHLGHGAASHLFVDATHVPLRRLVLPLHYHNAGGPARLPPLGGSPGGIRRHLLAARNPHVWSSHGGLYALTCPTGGGCPQGRRRGQIRRSLHRHLLRRGRPSHTWSSGQRRRLCFGQDAVCRCTAPPGGTAGDGGSGLRDYACVRLNGELRTRGRVCVAGGVGGDALSRASRSHGTAGGAVPHAGGAAGGPHTRGGGVAPPRRRSAFQLGACGP
mmetsp:Transcript_25599/g.82611  ORF Transcript_25599/g.82611 Transcript_25599/m.82611 type:complete len:249 (+) Transcript_25599:799-1545(+)